MLYEYYVAMFIFFGTNSIGCDELETFFRLVVLVVLVVVVVFLFFVEKPWKYLGSLLVIVPHLTPLTTNHPHSTTNIDNLDKRQQAVEELQKLFGQMSHSLREWVDTEAFTRCLQLDGGIQQDVHEFYKLIIDFLEVGEGRE